MRVTSQYGKWVVAAALAFACLGCGSRCLADDLILKNGTKITGNIVGFEKGMFKVETEFGVALVRKDKVASVQISSAPAADDAPKSPTSTGKAVTATTEGAAMKSLEAGSSQPVAPPLGASAAKPSPPPASRPIDEPLPAPLKEHVEGATYVNDTFQFAMFKPLGWKIYEGVPKETGSGITAIGTDDEHTLLIVDRQVWSGVPDISDDRVEARLRQTYQEYRKLSEEKTTCDGLPAIRREFTGVIDGVEWHGLALHVARDNTVFGLIGLTSAETYEFQQAVLSKIARSFHFLNASPTGRAQAANSSP